MNRVNIYIYIYCTLHGCVKRLQLAVLAVKCYSLAVLYDSFSTAEVCSYQDGELENNLMAEFAIRKD